MSVPNTRYETEVWLTQLGVGFHDVWFFSPDKNPQWYLAAQVDDPETFAECVRQELHRGGTRYALWHNGTSWSLMARFPHSIKTYPSREAAEMFAIHRG